MRISGASFHPEHLCVSLSISLIKCVLLVFLLVSLLISVRHLSQVRASGKEGFRIPQGQTSVNMTGKEGFRKALSKVQDIFINIFFSPQHRESVATVTLKITRDLHALSNPSH